MTTYNSHDYPPDYPFPDIEEPSTRKRLPIPDLRFEQVYLKRIQDCIHIESIARDVKEKGPELPVEVETEDIGFASATHTRPLVNSTQQVVRVDWGKVVYITLRDQVMMPLLQGMLW